MTKKIYFIGGRFADDQQRDTFWTKYGLTLKQVYNVESDRDARLKDYKFIPIYKCDREEFERIWTNPETYGIFWFSHGTGEGYPVAHHSSLDERPWEGLNRGEWESSLLKPERMPQSSPNLRIAVFLGCKLGRLEEKWKQKMPPGAQLFAYGDDMWAGAGDARTSLDSWIKNRLLLTKPKSPTEGARYLLRYLADAPTSGGIGTQRITGADWLKQKRPQPMKPVVTPPQGALMTALQQRQQMDVQRRLAEQAARQRTQQQLDAQRRIAQQQADARHQREAEEARRRRETQEAQQRAREEAQRRSREEEQRRQAREQAERQRQAAEAQRRQLAIQLARIKPYRPLEVRPRIWSPPPKPPGSPFKIRTFTGGPPYIGGVPMGGNPRPDFVERIKTRW